MARERKPRELKVGDYVYNSWGYDQTNIDYYKVVGLAGKQSVKIIPVVSRMVGNSIATDHVSPGDEEREFDVILKHKKKGEKWASSWKKGDGPITKLCDGDTVILDERYRAWKCEPDYVAYETAAGFGH